MSFHLFQPQNLLLLQMKSNFDRGEGWTCLRHDTPFHVFFHVSPFSRFTPISIFSAPETKRQ
jgi:hypothetical protein